MLQLAMNELTTYRWSFEDDIEYYKAAGFDGIGVWRQKLADYGEDDGIERLRASGLKVSSLQWAGGFTGSDGRSHAESIDDGLEAVHLAAEMRADCLVAYTGGRGGHTRRHAWRLTCVALSELGAVAEALSVNVAVKPMHLGCGSECTFLHDLDAALELLTDVNAESVKLLFDTYHLAQDERVLDRLPEIVPRLALVHLGDARHPPDGEMDRCPLGEGCLPLREIITALNESGYRGFYEVKLMGPEIELLDYCELIAAARRECQDLLTVPN